MEGIYCQFFFSIGGKVKKIESSRGFSVIYPKKFEFGVSKIIRKNPIECPYI